MKRPYFVIIDPEGAEIEGSRRKSTGNYDRDLRIRAYLENQMGPGCAVEYRA